MKIPVLEKGCCGCCAIPTCVKVQAVFKMIGAVMAVLRSILDCIIYEQETTDRESQTAEAWSCALQLVLYLLQAVLCALLIHGVFKSNHRYIKPYLYAEAATMVLFVLGIVLCLALGLPAAAVALALILLLDVYCWLHVYSLYVSQKQEIQGFNQPEHPNYAGGQEPTYQGYQSPTSGYVPQAPAQDMVP